MSEDKKRPNIPLFLHAKDIAILENCSQSAAQSKFKRYKKAIKAPKLSTRAYCLLNHVSNEEIAWHLNRVVIIFLKYTAAAAILVSCSTRFIDYPKLWDTMKVKWKESSSTYRRGYLHQIDEKTGEEHAVMVEVKQN